MTQPAPRGKPLTAHCAPLVTTGVGREDGLRSRPLPQPEFLRSHSLRGGGRDAQGRRKRPRRPDTSEIPKAGVSVR